MLAVPEPSPLALLLFVDLSVRLTFYGSAPPFLNPDSGGYYVPGRNLVAGDGFHPSFQSAIHLCDPAYVGSDSS